MATFFTNEDVAKVVNTTGQYGFVASSLNATDIIDNSIHSMNSLGRMVSSIPTPFARLFMFSGAFEHLNCFQNDSPKDGHDGVWNVQKKKIEPTIYHKLVSECLDLLEFIFKNGNRLEFHVTRWNIKSETNALIDSGQQCMVNLGKALLDAHKNTALSQVSEISLFSWGDGDDSSNCIFLGGTTPASLVYTSANLKRQLQERGLYDTEEFRGDAGNELFSDVATPLYKRSKEFRSFMYQYHRLEISRYVDTYNGLYDIDKYIIDTGANYDVALWNKMLGTTKYDGIRTLKSQGLAVKCGDISLYHIEDNINLSESDYIMDATVKKPYKELINGRECTYTKPLFLTSIGVPKLIYGKNREWNPNIDRIPNVLGKEVSSRVLPGFRQTYPYLTVDDFLESKIIEVSYNIDTQKFYTGNIGDINFLLPLKKEFFKYFELSDLVNEDGSYTDMITIRELNQNKRSVEVIVKIPLVNKRVVEVYKKYEEEDIVNYLPNDCTFDFAIFPFYRLVDTSKDTILKNMYSVMVGTTVRNIDTHFYQISDLRERIKNIELTNVTGGDRCDGKLSNIITKHIQVPSNFDIMELNVNGVRALVLPIFPKIDISNVTNVISYCIDFGTTNTHIVYSLRTRSKVENGIGIKDIKTLDITDSDIQVATFHGEDGPSEFVSFPTVFKREFVPSRINNECNIHYPMRTTVCQVNVPTSNLELFLNTNIGFNYDEEIVVNNDKNGLFTYYTNIKWDLKDVLSSHRIREYFKEILWIMRNKALLNGAEDKFDVVVTYPQSMRKKEKNAIFDAWEEAKKALGCNNVKIIVRAESITPYYAYLSTMQYNRPYVNFDIGGGTTDILYVDPDSNESVALSAFFAANDLWNDGIKDGKEPVSNGFIKEYDKSDEYNLMLPAYQQNYQNIKNISDNSEDVVNYLFVHDDQTNFSKMIQKSKHFELLFVHFASLIYYMAYSVDLLSVSCPKYITFTGMGSKYIKLLSSDKKDIAELINLIFKFYSKQFKKEQLFRDINVEVEFAEQPKEVTAQGGLIMQGHNNIIVPDDSTIYGYKDENYGDSIRGREIDSKIDSVMDLYDDFLMLFDNDSIKDALSKIDIILSSNLGNNLRSFAMESLKAMKTTIDDDQKDYIITEPIFFWCLKNSLYRMSKVDCLK